MKPAIFHNERLPQKRMEIGIPSLYYLEYNSLNFNSRSETFHPKMMENKSPQGSYCFRKCEDTRLKS